jgi:hypothetical protein
LAKKTSESFLTFSLFSLSLCAQIFICNNIWFAGSLDLALKIMFSKRRGAGGVSEKIGARFFSPDLGYAAPSVKILHFCSDFGAKTTTIRILQDRLQTSQKLCKSTFAKFQQYLRQFSFNIAPVPFLYS